MSESTSMVPRSAANVLPALPPLPEPRVPVRIREATMADLGAIDALQKRHSRSLGFLPRKALEGKVARNEVLVAEAVGWDSSHHPDEHQAVPEADGGMNPTLLGYLIASDRYLKREELGYITQMCVVPEVRRSLVAAALLKAQFDRSAYGCRLYCCWCAQDLEANRFWESMGFVALAYRAGSEKKSRVHIFWQKRIRGGDEQTPWWFPSQTTGGSIREDRLVLPIPPGVHWSEAKPIVLPGAVGAGVEVKALPAPRKPREKSVKKAEPEKSIKSGGLRFAIAPPAPPPPAPKPVVEKPKREKRKNDPNLIAAARELRDRWLEAVEEEPSLLEGAGRYDLARALPASALPALKALPTAA